MIVELVSIDQKYALNGGASYTALTFVLPSGRHVSIPVAEDVCEALVLEAQSGAAAAPAHVDVSGNDYHLTEAVSAPPVPAVGKLVAPPQAVAHPPVEMHKPTMVHWPSLSAEQLPLDIRETFVRANLPEEVTVDEFLGLMREVHARLAEAEEAQEAAPVYLQSYADAQDGDPTEEDGVDQL